MRWIEDRDDDNDQDKRKNKQANMTGYSWDLLRLLLQPQCR